MITTATKNTIKDLDDAIRKFGTYQLEDKGAVEVMNVEAIEARLRQAGVQTAIETLRALSEHEHGAPLIHWLIMTFVEDEPGWDELVDALEADRELHMAYVPWLGDAPDCTKCGASNAGSREAPFQCETCNPIVSGVPLSDWAIPGLTDEDVDRFHAALQEDS